MANRSIPTRAKTASPILTLERLEQRTLLSTTGPVTGVTLISADTNSPVPGISLVPGATIDLATVGHRLNIRAELQPGASVGSVRFNYDGDPNYKIENFAPYDIGGDAHGGRDFLPWLPTVGTHTLIVTPYPQPGATGQPGLPYLLLFNVLDSSTPAQPYFVNAGGPAYTDSTGELFSPDANFTGGRQVFSNFPVAQTTDDPLYQSQRQGPHFSFSRRLPDDTYAVTLYFADPGSPDRGRRPAPNVFDVSAEGKTLLDHYNIASDAGLQTAVQKTFIVPVTDGRLTLDFRADQGNAMVSAISLVPQRVPLQQAPLYVNAGGLSFTDSLGRTFEPATGFAGGSTSQSPWSVDSVLDPTFYSYRSGPHFTFSQPAANGDYELFLEMADPTSTQPGQRVFNVSAEGKTLLTNYDLFADAGPRHAIAKAFDVQVTGGTFNLDFTAVTGDAIVSSIVLIPKDIPTSVFPYTRQGQSDALKMQLDQRNLAQIGLDLILYANGQVRTGQRFPNDLTALVPQFEVDAQTLISPRSSSLLPRGELSGPEEVGWSATLNDYIYNGAGKNTQVDPNFPLAYDNPDRVAGDINILFGDGHVGQFSRAAAAQILGLPIADPTSAPPSIVPPPTHPRIVDSRVNLRLIGIGAYDYALTTVRTGLSLPLDMGSIAQFESLDPPFFINPRGSTPPPPTFSTRDQMPAWVNASTDYIYVGGHKTASMPPTALIAYENPAAMPDAINLLRGDAVPDFREMRWALETILSDRAQFPRSYT